MKFLEKITQLINVQRNSYLTITENDVQYKSPKKTHKLDKQGILREKKTTSTEYKTKNMSKGLMLH